MTGGITKSQTRIYDLLRVGVLISRALYYINTPSKYATLVHFEALPHLLMLRAQGHFVKPRVVILH